MDGTQGRGWLWSVILAAAGIYNVATYFHQDGMVLYPLVVGAGCLLAVPQAFFHPAAFLKPFGVGAPRWTLIDWLGLIGGALILIGIAIRLFS
jgi:hypothetical protein